MSLTDEELAAIQARAEAERELKEKRDAWARRLNAKGYVLPTPADATQYLIDRLIEAGINPEEEK